VAVLGRFLLIGIVASFIATILVGILGASNLVWGEDDQYGRVDIPGTATLQLPAGTVKVSVAINLPGRGNETPDLPFPDDLSLMVAGPPGAPQPVVTKVDESTSNAMDDTANTQREAYSVAIPADGAYVVTADGDFTSIGIDPQFWFGHETPISGFAIPALGLLIGFAAAAVWVLLVPLIKGARRPPG
jgi:hypothetical protein